MFRQPPLAHAAVWRRVGQKGRDGEHAPEHESDQRGEENEEDRHGSPRIAAWIHVTASRLASLFPCAQRSIYGTVGHADPASLVGVNAVKTVELIRAIALAASLADELLVGSNWYANVQALADETCTRL